MSPGNKGRLILVPNTLDLGAEPVELAAALPPVVVETAARLDHWLVEDAKSARAFLKRVHAVVPLSTPLQALHITELPRPAKGAAAAEKTDRHAPRGARGGTASGAPSGALSGALSCAPSSAPAHAPARAAMTALLAPALEGHDIGLLSEAGLPAVADPGAAVVLTAHELGLEVLPLPGASSLLLALAASGLDGQSFAFVGYLPQEGTARLARIRELEGNSKRLRQTQIIIETPYRNAALLAALLEGSAPATRLSISQGLTLPGGWSRTATVARWRQNPPALAPRWPAVFLLLA